jgi:hypothetical protein
MSRLATFTYGQINYLWLCAIQLANTALADDKSATQMSVVFPEKHRTWLY